MTTYYHLLTTYQRAEQRVEVPELALQVAEEEAKGETAKAERATGLVETAIAAQLGAKEGLEREAVAKQQAEQRAEVDYLLLTTDY